MTTTFGQFFDAVAARSEAAGNHRYTMKHDWLRKMTAEEWEKLRDSPLTLEAFNSFARRQRDYLNMSSAFVPSDSAFNEIHERTMRFMRAVMEVGRQFGLKPDVDWVNANVPNPPELEKMASAQRELNKPYNCSLYRIATAPRDSKLPDVFVEIWQGPTLQVERDDWPTECECVEVVGADTKEEILTKVDLLREKHNVVLTAPWPAVRAGDRMIYLQTA